MLILNYTTGIAPQMMGGEIQGILASKEVGRAILELSNRITERDLVERVGALKSGLKVAPRRV
jgi:hypothetical protein